MQRKKFILRSCFMAILLALGGCSTFPSFRPHEAVRTIFCINPSAQCINCPEFRKKMDRHTNSVLTNGNSIRLMQNGEKVFPAMLKAIANARKSVNICAYTFNADTIGREFIATLREAALRGVKVKVIFDDFGTLKASLKDFACIVSAGGEVREFNPKNSWTAIRINNRCHRKILTIDGEKAYMGGLNIGDDYNGNGNGKSWRDMAVEVKGPAVYEIEKVFAQAWNQAGTCWFGKNPPLVGLNWAKAIIDYPVVKAFNLKYVPPHCIPVACGSTPIRVIEQSPGYADSYILNMYLVAINSATKTVYITTPYFIPSCTLKRSLIKAAKRGVDVRILTQKKNDQPLINGMTLACSRDLIKNDIKVYGWDKSILHAKTIVVDGKWCSIGSTNLDGRALFLNYEANLSIPDENFSLRIQQVFLKDISISPQYTLEELNKTVSNIPFYLLPFKGQF